MHTCSTPRAESFQLSGVPRRGISSQGEGDGARVGTAWLPVGTMQHAGELRHQMLCRHAQCSWLALLYKTKGTCGDSVAPCTVDRTARRSTCSSSRAHIEYKRTRHGASLGKCCICPLQHGSCSVQPSLLLISRALCGVLPALTVAADAPNGRDELPRWYAADTGASLVVHPAAAGCWKSTTGASTPCKRVDQTC